MTGASQPETKRTFEGVELLRVLSILGIIWFHIEGLPYRRAGFSGLIAFVLVLVVLAGRFPENTTLKVFLIKRSRRILLPWIFWFAIYSCLNVVNGRPPLQSAGGLISSILAGPWIGLWFLPFAFLVSFLSWAVARIPYGAFSWGKFILLLSLSFLGLHVAQTFRELETTTKPWGQWLHAAPAIPLGMAVTIALHRRSNWPAILGICLIPVLYAVTSRYSDPGLALPYMIAAPCTLLAFLLQIKMPLLVTNSGQLVMGVYLVHGLMLSFTKRCLGPDASLFIVFGLAVLLAFSLTYFSRKFPWLREVF